MREFVIKQWKGLELTKAEEPAGPSPSVHPCPPVSPPEPIAILPEEAPPEAAPEPTCAPAEDAPQEAEALESPPRPRAARRRGDRNFVVAYDGKFVGVFEAEEELTPREAFVRIAGDLSSREDFDPEKIQLYKPVLLRSARPPKGTKFVPGKLTEIGGRIHEGHGGEAAEASPNKPEAPAQPDVLQTPVEETTCLELT